MPKAIPDGYHVITPYLIVRDAKRSIAFYESALGAKELYRLPAPNNRVGHAEVQIGDCRVMLSDESPEWGTKSPQALGGTPVQLCVYCDDVDELARRFVAAGGKVIRPVQTQFYGDRSGQFEDPDGHKWTLSQHVEDVAPEEMMKRMSKLMA